MIFHITNETPVRNMEEDCELKKMEGLLKDLSIYMTSSGKELILKNSLEILIPEAERKNLLQTLHDTHLESDYMKRLARGKFFWLGMSAEIEKVYESCEDCIQEGLSKVHKRATVIPEDLSLLAPGESVSMDYATIENKKYLILKDKATGFLHAKITKDQTTGEAQKVVHEWAYTFGIPHVIKTDGGPAFRHAFKSYLLGLGIDHVVTSAYNPQSNGLAERGVRQIKDVIKKTKSKPTPALLREICFSVNNHIQPEGGSAAERFFRRGVKSKLPNSIIRQLDHNALIKQRSDKQVRIAQQKGRSSKDEFAPEDRVIIQDMHTKRWTIKGTVKLARPADDNSIQSYEIETDDGTTFLRNKRYVKHDRNWAMNRIARVVRFADEGEQPGLPLSRA